MLTECRQWRHLDLGGVQTYIEYDRRRVRCRRCGWKVEKVPWADDERTWFTRDFDDMIAYWAQRTNRTAVAQAFRTTWRSAGGCIERVVARLRPKDPLGNLTVLGVDEISYRKHHHYLTVVVDLERGKVVWSREGKSAETLAAFFEELGEERRKKLTTVAMDMGAAYIKAVSEAVPHAQIVFDRFHVQQLVNGAVDETRREEWNLLRKVSKEAASALKGTRWALLKHEEDLRPSEKLKLSVLQQENKRLYRAYLLKEEFVEIMNRRQPQKAQKLLKAWLAWAVRSRLPSFVKVASTIKAHWNGIVAYFDHRWTNAVTEGLNTKSRLLTRVAYGFHSAEAAIAMIMLCCTDINVELPLKRLAG